MNKILFTILDEENLQRKNPKCNSITSKSGHTRSRLGNCSRSCSRSRLYTSRTNGICINHLCELQTHIHSRKSILPPNTCTSLKLPSFFFLMTKDIGIAMMMNILKTRHWVICVTFDNPKVPSLLVKVFKKG